MILFPITSKTLVKMCSADGGLQRVHILTRSKEKVSNQNREIRRSVANTQFRTLSVRSKDISSESNDNKLIY